MSGDGVTKLTATVLVPLDEDGTPLHNGERMIEVRPGVWSDPLAVALTRFLEGRAPGT